MSKVVGGETYKVVIACNGYTPTGCAASGGTCRVDMVDAGKGIAVVSVDRPENGSVEWRVKFAK